MLATVGDLSGEDKSALDLLCKIFSKNMPDTLVYMYEEYEVKHIIIQCNTSLFLYNSCCFLLLDD